MHDLRKYVTIQDMVGLDEIFAKTLRQLCYQLGWKMCSSRTITVQEDGKNNETPTPFEEAVSLTGTGRFHTWLLMVCGLCLTSVMLEVFSTSFLLPSAQCDLQLTYEDKGLLSAICNIGMVVSSHLWGFMADTRGRKNIIILTLLLDSLCTILESFAHVFWMFLVLRFLNGFFIVGPAAVVYAYLGEFHSSRTRSKALMWVCVFIGLGICLLPGLAWLVIPQSWSFQLPWCTYKSWRIFVFLCALPCLLTAILMKFTLPESPKFLMAMGHKDQALKVLGHMYSLNTGNSPERFPVKSLILVEESSVVTTSRSKNPVLEVLQHMWVQTKPLFLPPFLYKTLLACIIQYGLYASANGLSLWMPDIFNRLAEHAAMNNNTPCSICEAYSVPSFQQTVPIFDLTEGNSTALNMNDNTFSPLFGNNTEALYHDFRNDTAVSQLSDDTLLYCNNDTRVIYDNDKLSVQCNNKIINLACKNSSVFLKFRSDSTFLNGSSGSVIQNLNNVTLNLSINNDSVILDFLKNAGWSSMTIHTCSGAEVFCTSDEINDTEDSPPECNTNVDITAFQNTLVIGSAGALSYIIVGFLINLVEKKKILVFSLVVAGVAGTVMNLVYSQLAIILMVGTFITLSGMCISVVISVVIELFPTHLRAMATCISLMFGRMGSITVNFMLGALLENNCTLMIYVLGGLCISCGLFSLLIPSTKKSTLK